jgi:hypothetical protein
MDASIHLFTIVAEPVLEERLVRDVENAGATGWTITTCRGHSAGGSDIGEFEGGNIRLEVLIPERRLDVLWSVLQSEYFERYSVIAWSHPVSVRRTAKYAGGGAPSNESQS